MMHADEKNIMKPTCVLLLDTNEYLGGEAEKFCRTLFDVKLVTRCNRGHKVLPPEVLQTVTSESIDYVFNFLSPLKVSKEILEVVKISPINFHPAPPEYPGVGCASYALFDALGGGKWEYGVSAHIMEEAYDSGTILKVNRFSITKGDYCDTLFERSLSYTLFLFFEVLAEIAEKGMLKPSGDTWARKSGTRKEFDEWMVLRPNDSEDTVRRKIRATRHNRFPGPYVEIFGERFALPPRDIK